MDVLLQDCREVAKASASFKTTAKDLSTIRTQLFSVEKHQYRENLLNFYKEFRTPCEYYAKRIFDAISAKDPLKQFVLNRIELIGNVNTDAYDVEDYLEPEPKDLADALNNMSLKEPQSCFPNLLKFRDHVEKQYMYKKPSRFPKDIDPLKLREEVWTLIKGDTKVYLMLYRTNAFVDKDYSYATDAIDYIDDRKKKFTDLNVYDVLFLFSMYRIADNIKGRCENINNMVVDYLDFHYNKLPADYYDPIFKLKHA